MSSLPRSNGFTLEEYFALERVSERRFEYRGGEIVCMSGGTLEHATIARNVISRLFSNLPKGCQVYSSDLAVFVPDGRPYRYPDISVVCGERRIRSVDGRDCLENPVLLIEVLSATSADFDRGTKFEEYKSIPEFAEYLLISQERPHITRRRKQEDGSWVETVFTSLAAAIRLDSISTDLDVYQAYEGIAFDSSAIL